MKNSVKKIIKAALKKFRQNKEQIKKLQFSNFKEDFVITAQEEKEGGFFGISNFRTTSS